MVDGLQTSRTPGRKVASTFRKLAAGQDAANQPIVLNRRPTGWFVDTEVLRNLAAMSTTCSTVPPSRPAKKARKIAHPTIAPEYRQRDEPFLG